jgi:hypothetical protein
MGVSPQHTLEKHAFRLRGSKRTTTALSCGDFLLPAAHRLLVDNHSLEIRRTKWHKYLLGSLCFRFCARRLSYSFAPEGPERKSMQARLLE